MLSWLKIVNWGSNAEEVGPSVNGVVEVVWIKFGDEEVVNVSLKFEFGSMVVAINVIIKFRFELDYEGRKEFGEEGVVGKASVSFSKVEGNGMG